MKLSNDSNTIEPTTNREKVITVLKDDDGGVDDDINPEFTESQGSTFDQILEYDRHSLHQRNLLRSL